MHQKSSDDRLEIPNPHFSPWIVAREPKVPKITLRKRHVLVPLRPVHVCWPRMAEYRVGTTPRMEKVRVVSETMIEDANSGPLGDEGSHSLASCHCGICASMHGIA